MACNKCYQKSALTAYTNTNTTVTTGNAVPLANNYLLTGSSITHTTGSTAINLVKSGLYLVTFSATLVEAGTAGNVTLQLYRKGVAVPSAITSSASSTTDIEDIGASTLIEVDNVCPCGGVGVSAIPLTLVSTGVGATYNNISVTVVKLA